MSLSLAGAELLALLAESISFGIFVVLAIQIFTAGISHWKDGKHPTRLLLLILIMMVLFATAHLVIDFLRAFNAFILSLSAEQYYKNLATRLFVAKCAMNVLQLSLGSSVNIWRLFIASNKSSVVTIPPILCLVATSCLGIVMIVKLAKFTPMKALVSCFLPYIILRVLDNIYCTVGIVWIIWGKGSRQNLIRSLLPILMIIIESSALYSIALIIYMATFLSHSNGLWPATDILVPLVGILYCLIVQQARYTQKRQSIPKQTKHRDASPEQLRGRTASRSPSTDDRTIPSLSIEIIDIVAQPLEQCKDGTKGGLDNRSGYVDPEA